jgi:hypothetical protein
MAIASYLGRGDVFDHALAAFAEAYADQNEADYRAVAGAAAAGVVPTGEAREVNTTGGTRTT